MLRQRILRLLVPWIFVRGNKRYLRQLVLWNILFKGKRKNQKNSQAVSPLNLLTRGRRKNQKNSQAVSPLNYSGKRKRQWRKRIAANELFLNKENIEQKNLRRMLWMNERNMKVLSFWMKGICLLNSCHGHIFIIIWWLKLKFVTLGNFFKTSHFKSCDSFEKLITLKVVTLFEN